jgi:large subunit ribosomal protein L32
MAVPRRRTSKTAKRKRRTHFKLGAPGVGLCSNCGQKKLPHQACPHCGYYDGREVIEIEE